jgi:hypothetical protein
MILRSQEEVDKFLKSFDPDYYRTHSLKPTKFPVLVKYMEIQDVYKEVYFCPFYLEDAKSLMEEPEAKGQKNLSVDQILDELDLNCNFMLQRINDTKATRIQLDAMVKQGIFRQDSNITWHLIDLKFLNKESV